jgi:Leucine-rich repeat (LRR) protein
LGNCESLEDIELDQNAFTGSIPVSLGKIRTLKVLNLSHNNLIGSIPASLGNLQLIEQLDLSFNNLKGEVPTKGIFKNTSAMRIDGNQELCSRLPELHLPACPAVPLGSDKHELSDKHVLLAVVIISVLLLFRRQKRTARSISLPSFGREIPKNSYSDLFRATDGFAASNLVGRGRYGSAYQGKLFQDGSVVAIKVFCLDTRGAQKSFIAECNALRNVQHRNLVPILTACSTMD